MFKRLIKNKKAQNTAEYAILISLVVAGIIAMQTYAQRGLQARVRDAAVLMVDTGTTAERSDGTPIFDGTPQYEPYYLDSSYDVARDDTESQILTADDTNTESYSSRNRENGYQASGYDADTFVTPGSEEFK